MIKKSMVKHLGLVAVLLLVVSCGGESTSEVAQSATVVDPTATPVPPTATPVPPTPTTSNDNSEN